MNVLALTGSLHPASCGNQILEAAQAMAPPGVNISRWPSVGALRQVGDGLPEPRDGAVHGLRRAVDGADVVMIATAEHAHPRPGRLDAALAWLAASGSLRGKRVVLVSAAWFPGCGVGRRETLETALHAQGAELMWSSTIAVRPQRDGLLSSGTTTEIRRLLFVLELSSAGGRRSATGLPWEQPRGDW